MCIDRYIRIVGDSQEDYPQFAVRWSWERFRDAPGAVLNVSDGKMS